MRILGLNGWNDGTHDPAAALLVDGQVTAFVEEERLSRRKHGLSGVPHLAVRAVLAEAGLQLDDIDVIAYGWDLPGYTRRGGGRWDLTDSEFIRAVTGLLPSRWPRLVWVQHHDAHAASAYFASGFTSAAVIVADGQGETDAVSLYAASGCTLEPIRRWPGSRSLGLLYQAVTEYCGFSSLEPGKTMGLAAWGKVPSDELPLRWADHDLISPVPDDSDWDSVIQQWKEILLRRFGEAPSVPAFFDPILSRLRARDDYADPHRAKVAAAGQQTVERNMVAILDYVLSESNSRNVCIAGGVGLNCVANGMLVDKCDQLFIQPAAHDAGVALGAALKVASDCGEPPCCWPGADLGPRYSSELVGRFLETCRLPARRVPDPALDAANRLARGQVIGWFEGRMEVGPRALGHRSILALAYPEINKLRVNQIKSRELWRPLAPSLLSEAMPSMFGRSLESPYMLLSFPLTPRGLRVAPAAAHVDKSARPQTVPPGAGPFRHLLERVEEATGLGVVLNTSFNGPGEPIVCTPPDAVRTFMTLGLDALVLGDFVLTKSGE